MQDTEPRRTAELSKPLVSKSALNLRRLARAIVNTRYRLVYIVDLVGTFFFAVSGGLMAVKHKLDLLGIVVLALLTGVGGGILRDVVLGSNPPAAFLDEWYFVSCIAAAAAVFFLYRRIDPEWPLMRIADAIGLGVFAAAGASKAYLFGLGPIGVIMMAALTATGGGLVRDLLVRQIPMVLQRDFYATATLIGGGVFVAFSQLELPPALSVASCILVTTGLRLFALAKGLQLPRADTSLP